MRLVKVIMSTGKTAYLREMKISDTEKAAQKVSKRCEGDSLLMQVMIKKALLQSLLVKMADSESAQPKDLTAVEREDLDSLLTVSEYAQILQIIGKMSDGEDSGNEAKMEFVEA